MVNDVNSSDLGSVPRWEKFLKILSQLSNEKIVSLHFINSKYNLSLQMTFDWLNCSADEHYYVLTDQKASFLPGHLQH